VLPIPVDVLPFGVIAGSAGTVTRWAAHRAAMAPDTVVVAANPVGPGEIEIVDVNGIHLIRLSIK